MTLDQLRAYRYHIRHPTEQGFADMAEVERFVKAIPNDYIRPMVSAYYIDGLTWSEVCAYCCPRLLPDHCRVYVNRYLISIGVEPPDKK